MADPGDGPARRGVGAGRLEKTGTRRDALEGEVPGEVGVGRDAHVLAEELADEVERALRPRRRVRALDHREHAGPAVAPHQRLHVGDAHEGVVLGVEEERGRRAVADVVDGLQVRDVELRRLQNRRLEEVEHGLRDDPGRREAADEARRRQVHGELVDVAVGAVQDDGVERLDVDARRRVAAARRGRLVRRRRFRRLRRRRLADDRGGELVAQRAPRRFPRVRRGRGIFPLLQQRRRARAAAPRELLHVRRVARRRQIEDDGRRAHGAAPGAEGRHRAQAP